MGLTRALIAIFVCSLLLGCANHKDWSEPVVTFDRTNADGTREQVLLGPFAVEWRALKGIDQVQPLCSTDRPAGWHIVPVATANVSSEPQAVPSLVLTFDYDVEESGRVTGTVEVRREQVLPYTWTAHFEGRVGSPLEIGFQPPGEDLTVLQFRVVQDSRVYGRASSKAIPAGKIDSST